ncbi:sensor histidine kinase [Acidothermaceae bacterium B102]|nr:sensor histidine kinase [Acidothermaceae bacterium B102]
MTGTGAIVGPVSDNSVLEWATPGVRGRSGDGPRRWRRGGGIWLLYLLNPLGQAWTHHRLVSSLTGTALLVAFALVYLFLVPRGWWGHGQKRYGVRITALVLSLAIAETAVIGVQGLTALVFVSVSAVMLLGNRASIAFGVTLAVVASILPQFIGPWHLTGVQWDQGAQILLAGLAVFGFSRLIRANHELAAARNEVAVLAAERERARIARDMHDLLGHSLTTVTVKASLAGRLVDSDPERAKVEIRDVERLAREALADVRATVTGFRDVRLSTELIAARQVLEAAGIRAELPGAVDNVEGDLGGLFGWVLREGVTNVVRHSRAGRVVVTVEPRAIEIVDDGVCAGSPALQGNGLSGIAERVASAGGRMLAGPGTSTGYRLRVEVPA